MEQLDLFTKPKWTTADYLQQAKYDLELAEKFLAWYTENPLYKDELRNTIRHNQNVKKINDLNNKIKHLEKQLLIKNPKL